MISEEQLLEYAAARNMDRGQAEKDFFQNVVLFLLYQEHGKELVFKGGTALAKCYGLNRFSEDLDFTATKEIKTEHILERGLKRFGLDFEIAKEKVLIKGPLHTGIRQSMCSVRIEISRRERVLKEPNIVTIKTFTPVLPSFDVVCMDIREILAEKVRALMSRNQARDLYDLYVMREKFPGKNLVQEKLDYYAIRLSPEALEKAIDGKKRVWEKELKPLVRNVPEFKDVKENVLKAFDSRASGN